MAHAIFGKRFLSTREPAWHGIGQSWTGPKTAVEAVRDSNVAGIYIETREMGYRCGDGTFVPVDDKRVIVRRPTDDDPIERVLGNASPEYTVLQNTQIATALDVSGLTARWPVETCAALGYGETLFVCLDMGNDTIAGEDHKRYVLITDTRDGTSSVQVLTCWTRVVCANTLQVALEEGNVKISLSHNPTIEGDFQFSLDLLAQVQAQSVKTKRALEDLHALRVTHEQLSDVLDATYRPRPKGNLLRNYERIDDPTAFDPATLARLSKLADRHDYETQQCKVARGAAETRYETLCTEYPHLADTGLGVLNTVAEIADHTRNGRKSMASIYGWRADEKLRCYTALTGLM